MTPRQKPWKLKLHEIIYEADTRAGKVFDIALLITILLSIAIVLLESVPSINQKYHSILDSLQWLITILFTIEYVLRILTIKSPKKYIFSYYGIIDLLATLPKYAALLFGGAQSFTVLRALRLLRIFSILKITRYLGEANKLKKSLQNSKAKIAVFLFVVLVVSFILGTVMYLIEGARNEGFSSIPKSIYWTIVTLTTVGYGDISPITALGQFIASIVMILGYGIIAVPTGIVSAEYTAVFKETATNTQSCTNCGNEKHQDDASYCRICGEKL
ncbi:MAG: ion transporter [Flavicella sp.]